jgi:RimJ/RimL family protein N-acetyltransferase
VTAAPQDIQPAPLAGRRVSLRPVTEADYDFLYDLAVNPETAFRWRYRGATPSPATFVEGIWHGVLAQFIVVVPPATLDPRGVGAENGADAGHVLAYEPDLRNGHVAFAVAMAPEHLRTGLAVDSLVLFLNYLIENWNFRKLYAQTIEFNYAEFQSGLGRYFHEEGRLREHEFYAGKYWDVVHLAMYREELQALLQRLLPRVVGIPVAASEAH